MILNKVGSPRHAADPARTRWSRSACRCSACCPATTGSSRPSRHLGLVPAAERRRGARRPSLPLDRRDRRPRRPGRRRSDSPAPRRRSPPTPGIRADRVRRRRPATAAGGRGRRRAGLHLPLRRDRRAAARGRVPRWSRSTRCTTRRCPTGTAGLVLGGGFPEVHAAGAVGERRTARERSPTCRRSGAPTVAECAGLLYLARSLDGAADVRRARRRGADDAAADARLPRGGRRRATRCSPPPAPACPATSSTAPATHTAGRRTRRVAVARRRRHDRGIRPGQRARVVPAPALGRRPRLADRFVQRLPHGATSAGMTDLLRPFAPSEQLLAHHGDRDARPGLVDLAVNVRAGPRRRGCGANSTPSTWPPTPTRRPPAQPSPHATAGPRTRCCRRPAPPRRSR